MNKFRKIGVIIAMLLCVAGCSVKDTATTLLNQTYAVCNNLQQLVVKTDAQELAAIAKTAQTPLTLINTALLYVNTKSTDVKVKEVTVKAMSAINSINTALAKVTPENVVATKTTIIASLDEVKAGLKAVADLVGVKLQDVQVASNVEASKLNADLSKSVSDLQKTLDGLK